MERDFTVRVVATRCGGESFRGSSSERAQCTKKCRIQLMGRGVVTLARVWTRSLRIQTCSKVCNEVLSLRAGGRPPVEMWRWNNGRWAKEPTGAKEERGGVVQQSSTRDVLKVLSQASVQLVSPGNKSPAVATEKKNTPSDSPSYRLSESPVSYTPFKPHNSFSPRSFPTPLQHISTSPALSSSPAYTPFKPRFSPTSVAASPALSVSSAAYTPFKPRLSRSPPSAPTLTQQDAAPSSSESGRWRSLQVGEESVLPPGVVSHSIDEEHTSTFTEAVASPSLSATSGVAYTPYRAPVPAQSEVFVLGQTVAASAVDDAGTPLSTGHIACRGVRGEQPEQPEPEANAEAGGPAKVVSVTDWLLPSRIGSSPKLLAWASVGLVCSCMLMMALGPAATDRARIRVR